MAFLYKKGVKPGVPWIDYKESELGTIPDIVFIFKIENYLAFVLYEICIKYPCVAITGNAQLPVSFTAQLSSTQNQFTPKAILPLMVSSPSENYNLGVLDEEATGMRLIPVTLNYPFDRGDTLIVTVSGAPARTTIGCMISGRKYGGDENL